MIELKYFVFSDIHGCYKELIDSLDRAGYNKLDDTHKLIFIGDAFDKNRDDYNMYLFLKNNISDNKLIWVMGNHDLYLLNVLKNKKINKFCYHTVLNIAKGLDNKLNDIDDCINKLIDDGLYHILTNDVKYYFETKDYVFVHAFIPYSKKEIKYNPSWRDSSIKDWCGAINNMKGFKLAIKDKVLVPNKTLVLGHIGAYYGNLTKFHPNFEIDGIEFKILGNKIIRKCQDNTKYFKTFIGDGVIGIDSRCFETGFVNIFVFEEE